MQRCSLSDKQQETPTLKQIRQDVTRFRYGQEAHLDLALENAGPITTDEERRSLKNCGQK